MRTMLIAAGMVATMGWSGLAVADDTVQVRPQDEAEEPVGSYKQPNWTTARLFTQSRVYVLPENALEVEAWWKVQQFKDPKNNYQLYQQEIEYGLGHHLQADVYVNEQNYYNYDKSAYMNDLEGFQFEMRYALADWGQIFGNPTLYLEYHPVKDNPERMEFRVLLGDTIAPDWHWAMNVGYEEDLWGQKVDTLNSPHEIPVALGVSTTALCTKLAIGGEAKVEWGDSTDDLNKYDKEVDFGPSLQWRPVDRFHLDFTPLWGVTKVSPKTETWLILGLEI